LSGLRVWGCGGGTQRVIDRAGGKCEGGQGGFSEEVTFELGLSHGRERAMQIGRSFPDGGSRIFKGPEV
jgi:hypothetical protein